MAIRSSSAGEVERLVTRLRAGTAGEQEAAVARLRVIGARAIDRLAALSRDLTEPSHVRSAALRSLEGSSDPRACAAAMATATDGDASVAVAAIAVLGGWVTRDAGTSVLERLTALALDVARPGTVRLAALDAVAQLPPEVVQPLVRQVTGDVTALTTPDDPVRAREWLAAQADAPLSVLHDFIVTAREHEAREASARRRHDWQVTRGAAHVLLARRGSRVALYDLKETFDAATAPLAIDFLAAVGLVGDSACLEPMAHAWAAAAPTETWWRDRLAEAAQDIIHRTRLSGRSAVLKRVRSRYPGFI